MMTEQEYLLVGNRIRITEAIRLLSEVISDPPDLHLKVRDVIPQLLALEARLFFEIEKLVKT